MKRNSFFIILLILLMILSACGAKDDETATRVTNEPAADAPAPAVTEPEPVASSNDSIYLVGEQGYTPISFEENGEVVGISPDIIREVFKRMGKEVKLEVLPWKRCQQMVEEGSADGFFSPYFSEERDAKYTFAKEPLMIEKNVFIVKKDANLNYDGDLSKLSEYTFGTLNGYATLEEALSSGAISKVDYSDSVEQSIQKLITPDRNVDLVVNTNYILWYTAKNLGVADQIKELDTPLVENPSYIAFTKTKDMTAMAEEFSTILQEMKADGSYDLILEKYVGK